VWLPSALGRDITRKKKLNINCLTHSNYDELDGGRLKPHQAEGVDYMATTPRTLCADPVGAGKTVEAAGLIAHLVEAGDVGPTRPALWLTEGSTLAVQTARELARSLPDLTIRNLAGHRDLSSQAKANRRRRAISEPAHVKIVTFSQWNVRGHLGEEFPAVVILDEVSALEGGAKLHAAARATTVTAQRVHAFTATVSKMSSSVSTSSGVSTTTAGRHTLLDTCRAPPTRPTVQA
jgi:superfamily II DNA or RNA helicase